jgi:hypothetical protein
MEVVMTELPFSKIEQEQLRGLSGRVMNSLPSLIILRKCIITGPAVSQLAVNLIFDPKLDSTFVILAPDIDVYNDLIGYTGRTYLNTHNEEIKRIRDYSKWFGMDEIDLVSIDFTIVRGAKDMIIAYTDHDEYPSRFKAHPIYCLEGKTYVNRTRLNEAMKYVGK